jgi:hypothetical protein
MGKRNGIQSFSGKVRKKRPLGKPRCRWEVNIKRDLGEIECNGKFIWLRI